MNEYLQAFLVLFAMIVACELPYYIFLRVRRWVKQKEQGTNRVCLGCDAPLTVCVYRDKKDKDGNVIWRKYKCPYCGLVKKEYVKR